MSNELYETQFKTYVKQFPENIQEILIKTRQVIQQAAPIATEKFSYQMPTFVLNGNLVHFAAAKNHLGFYPAPSGIAAFQTELSPYKTAKGSAQFPYTKEIPYALITDIVRFRVQENTKR